MSGLRLNRSKLFQLLFSLVFMLGLSACDSPLTPTQVPVTPAVGAIPSPTPADPGPTATSASPTEDLSYVIEPDVAAEEQQQIKKMAELAVKEYGPAGDVQLLAKNILPHGSLLGEDEDDDTAGTATPGQIIIYIADSTGRRLSKNMLIITVLHEYYHQMQFHLTGVGLFSGLGGTGASDVYPEWLVEGSAEYEAYRVAGKNNLVSFERGRSQKVADARTYQYGLKQIEQNSRGDYSPYSLGFLGVEYLLSQHGGEAALKHYWQELGQSGQKKWESAFQKSFGLPPSVFYVQFESYRRNRFVSGG